MNKKAEKPFFNMMLNIVIPSFILIKLSSVDYLGPVKGLILALIFPLSYGIYGLIKNKKINLFSVIGLISVFLTGIFGLMELDVKWIVLKEAGVPLILGIFVLISVKTSFPVIKKLLITDQLLNLEKIYGVLHEKKLTIKFEKCLTISNYMLAGSFFLSSALNYILAKYMLVSNPGTVAFTAELGQMTAYSFPVIAVPLMFIMMLILFFIIRSITSLTGLRFTEILAVNLDTTKKI